jgi:DNA-binding NarL/FixJ family response regulator
VEPITLLIVDDHPLFRQGLVDVLETDEELQVVAEAADGDVAIAHALRHCPHVVLMDVSLPNANGLQVTRQIVNALPDTKVIILTGYDETEQIYHAIAAGAVAYCTKDIPPDALLSTVRAVMQGKCVINEQVMEHDQMMEWAQGRLAPYLDDYSADNGNSLVPLSPREMEILEMVTRGASNKEIAMRLNISQQTVKNHMTAILRKLRVDDRTQAAVYALRHGWVRLDIAH